MSHFHFTLGPVQGFVSQARRTRDFWAGSFLLSWLTARAMQAAEDSGGMIMMPSIDDDALLQRVRQTSGGGPNVGSLPNNFIAKVDDHFDGHQITKAVQQAWQTLADAVWKKDRLADAGVHKELWDEQIKGFWDMAWVISDSDDAAVLARRKNWRSYMPPQTVGDKCTVMGEWQELSGTDKPNAAQQRQFWNGVRGNIAEKLDLPENERLCAIAYVKRRFVHCWQQMDGHTGWELSTSVPSTSYMAAVHWLAALIQAKPDAQAAAEFCKQGTSGERLTRIKAISDALRENAADHLKGLADVDGRALFDSDKAEDRATVAAKKAMLKTVPDVKALLSPFYAIVMMDGDNLGKTKEAMGDASSLSAALAAFTKGVPDIVAANNGFLVYAGGDDVLAILPLEDALPCALEIQGQYMQVFAAEEKEGGKVIPASISAAIEFAHMKLPLTMILKDAHKLLDDVAKDKTGRDAVVCRIWKPGGQQQTWAMPWQEAMDAASGKLAIVQLANKLGKQENDDPGYANKFLYHLRETLEMLNDDTTASSAFDAQAIEDMLVADYVSSGLLDQCDDKAKEASALIQPLLRQCRVFENKIDTQRYDADGALLLRFLAQKGVER